MSDDLNRLAAIEKAISEKYGDETIQNPKANWDEEKEKEYLKQMSELYQKSQKVEEYKEKIDINGIKISKKLFKREPLRSCPMCNSFPRKSTDDVYLLKYDCCFKCYVQWVENREERWKNGWRPN